MARIRTIKPELWTSEDFCALTAIGSLTFLALIGHADDYGRLKATPQHIATTMLHRAATAARVADQLGVMEAHGMIRRYSANGADYIALPNWFAHQKISHPSKSAYPEPSGQTFLNFPENSGVHARATRAGPEGPEGPEGTVRTGLRANKKAPERITATELLAVAQQGQRPQ
jgi:hypothetical protein